jgi:hypothetical protein
VVSGRLIWYGQIKAAASFHPSSADFSPLIFHHALKFSLPSLLSHPFTLLLSRSGLLL